MTPTDRPSVTDNARAEALEDAAAQFDCLYRDGLMPKRAVLADLAEWADRSRRGLRPNGRAWAAGRTETTTDNLGGAYMLGYAAARARNAETTTEWGIRYPDGETWAHAEDRARRYAEESRAGIALVRREVTAWTEVDQ